MIEDCLVLREGREDISRRISLTMMSVKIKIVLLGMMCIGLVMCSSSRDIEQNVKSDEDGWVFCYIDVGHCQDNDVCNKECVSASFARGGYCKDNKCCCKI